MGIRGLNKFFDLNPGLSESYHLHDTAVVFDGDNLINFLYFTYKVPSLYGGDYDRYASVVRNYFSSYLECKIKPIVIFDGGHDRTDRKLNTIIKRINQRLESVDRIAKQESYSVDVLPIFAYNVFTDVIKDMHIAHARSSFEADGPISCIANLYRCPVISFDSDFYIFDVGYGFIRSDCVDTTVRVSRRSRGRQYNFLNCKIYYVDNFLSFFPGIEKNVLPLFSALIGNDFVDVFAFDDFFLSDEFPRVRSKKLKGGERYDRMIGLLEWLKTYRNVDDAIEGVIRHLDAKDRRPLGNLIKQAVDVYKASGSNLIKYLPHAPVDSDLAAISPEEMLTTFKGNCLPAWLVDSFHRANLPSYVLNIVGLRRMILPIQIEDISLSSTHNSSLSIRRVLYGLLVSLDGASLRNSGKIHIKEYDRMTNVLQVTLVAPTMRLGGYGTLPDLSKLQLNVIDAKYFVSCVLGEQMDYLSDLPDFLHLLAMSIRYWLRTSSPKPNASLFDALLLTVLYLTIAEPRVSEYYKTKDHGGKVGYRKLSSHIFETSTVSDAVKGVTRSNAAYYWSGIQKYFRPPEHDGRNPVAVSVVHSYNQLQSCVFHSMLLNDVSGRPFLALEIQCTFNGTLIYNLAELLQKMRSSEFFLSSILGQQSALDCLFKKLKNKLLDNLPGVFL